MKYVNIEKLLGIFMLLFAIGFNLWVYRVEPTATVDPNDNTFQYALVDRTSQIWDFAQQKCSGITKPVCMLSYLTDHWVPNWAEGYNLPYYYSHIPQITIVASWRFLSWFFSLFTIHYSLFTYYHWVIYLLLSLFPLSVFLSLLIIEVSPITAGFGALVATQLSTDGLYGLDPASFLWRGYGLSSQLFAMIWLPLALAYAWKLFRNVSRDLIPAILFLAATTSGHLGIGIIAFLSVGILSLSNLSDLGNLSKIKITLKKLLILYGGAGLLLGYWILPILKDGNYHNISVWDPIWKFDSYGYRQILKNFLNGDLFDFGRPPVLTGLVFLGFFAALQRKNHESGIMNYEKNKNHDSQFIIHNSYVPFSLLFIFWLLLYFGRTTWGNLIDLIPGMAEFHLSRFIVGVHIAGLFLIPLGFSWLVENVLRMTYYVSGKRFSTLIQYFMTGILLVMLIPALYGQTLRYASHNDTLIQRANGNYAAAADDTNSLLVSLRSLLATKPGRVFAGRGGTWGKDFRVAETPYYLYLSTYGVPVVLWLPETWSPNSDTEQYFSENRPADYALYNVRYVVTPATLAKEQIQPFWKLLTAGKTWRLYSVIPAQAGIGSGLSPQKTQIPDQVGNDNSFGYITWGVRPAIVSVTKTTYLNVVHLWIQSDFPKNGLYPELTFDKNYPKNYGLPAGRQGLPNFRMLDEVNYIVPDRSRHDLFAENPRYVSPSSPAEASAKAGIPHISLISQSSDHDMIFKASVDVPRDCIECILILKQSFHPSWQAAVDGKPVEPFAVFPFFTAVKLEAPGKHEIVFSYRPSMLKVILLVVSLISLLCLFWLACHTALNKIKAKL